jgi:5-methylcytosine-specific restriction endonuclease McrA
MSHHEDIMCTMPWGFRGGQKRADAVARLIARDGDACWYCGCSFVPGKRLRTIDHAMPLSLGGTNGLANLRLACARCNALKGATSQAAYLASSGLQQRRRRIAGEQRRVLGAFFPKRAYHHPEIRWFGKGRWACRVCHLWSVTGTRSPPTVPCRSLKAWPVQQR